MKPTKVRVRFLKAELEAEIPKVVRLLLSHYISECSQRNLCQISFSVDELPMSLNHSKFRRMKRSKKGRMVPFDILKPDVHFFRALTNDALRSKGRAWCPVGVTAAVIVFESPVWLTKEFRVRAEDADNKIKPLFDAIEKASTVSDSLHWNFHVFKVPSRKTRTIVWLFDLGEVVDYYG